MRTSEQSSVALSVRAEAQRTTPPDEARVHAVISATAESKAAAAARVQEVLQGLLTELYRLGGQVLTVESTVSALTWSAPSLRTQQEFAHNKTTGEHGPTGRHQASVFVAVAVRDFSLLTAVSAAFVNRDAIDVNQVQWLVDEDNGEWAKVRADAIRAALLKGQDYAAALSGMIVKVDHVADAGLLGGGEGGWASSRGVALSAMGSGGDDISLDPVPQVLRATIEARFTAQVRALPGT